MPAFSDYSATPNEITTIGGLSIAENSTALASINNIAREITANGRQLYNIVVSYGTPMSSGGGIFTGDILRSGRGGYLHWNGTGQTSGRIFLQPIGGPAPAGLANGDWLLEY